MSTSPATSAETINVSDMPVLMNVNMANVTKLTPSNYIMWNCQVHALLDGYNLAGANTAYALWKRQDKLLYSTVLGAISISVQPLLSTATTTTDIWNILLSTYVKPIREHIQQLRQQIKHWKKGSKSIDE
ncbi:hypothetical protein N665_0383s0102 [Sinapis alba]|nr:hypothetical protein N665_0383s0102 [Sinapis alba]